MITHIFVWLCVLFYFRFSSAILSMHLAVLNTLLHSTLYLPLHNKCGHPLLMIIESVQFLALAINGIVCWPWVTSDPTWLCFSGSLSFFLHDIILLRTRIIPELDLKGSNPSLYTLIFGNGLDALLFALSSNLCLLFPIHWVPCCLGYFSLSHFGINWLTSNFDYMIWPREDTVESKSLHASLSGHRQHGLLLPLTQCFWYLVESGSIYCCHQCHYSHHL